MRFTKFDFKNFRGIKSSTLDLRKTPKESVTVLVGLNESGKTTVLEAINHFRSNPDLKRNDPNSNARYFNYQAMLPIGERALFNDSISIKSTLNIEADDVILINEHLESMGFVEYEYEKTFTIEQIIKYQNSIKEKTINQWSLTFEGRKKKGATPFRNLKPEEWMNAVNFVEMLLPKVMYFPASLLEFPDRIVLDDLPKSKDPTKQPISSTNSFYCEVINDILKAIDSKFNISKHLVARAKSSIPADQQNLDALIQKIEAHLNKTVLGEWRNTLKTTLRNKKFRFYVKNSDTGTVYAEIKLEDSNNLFSLNERSAGFRWFFAFIMLAKYRVHRNDRVLFLFDEPAANLHPRAQKQLLEIFASLSKSHQFLFTTHSHYLINPLWLESTFVVKNEATSLDEDFLDVDPTQSEITITPYRTFVGNHLDQSFYYRPIMDALEYTPPQISPECASILIEGKTDYYCIEYFRKIYFPNEFDFSLFPGGGSTGLDSLISILSGWAVTFLILLDGDPSGEDAKTRYNEKFESLVADRIYTLKDILNSETKMRIEGLFNEMDLELIRLSLYPDEKILSKKLLHKAIQELLIGKKKLDFSNKTLENFHMLLTNLANEYKILQLI